MKKIKLSIFLLAAVGLMTSCNDFLNKYPDNRMELRTPSDVSKLVASAYPDAYPAYLLEMYSDNTDEQVNETWSSLDRFQEQAYGWADITETGVPDVPQKLWNASYSAISTANAAIEFIEKQSNQDAYQGQLGEAKICRAYAMFQLANVFCRAYNPNTADKELGLPYPYMVENDPRATYQRGTLAQLYSNIEKDLTEGMELISNNNYAQPKYHFTPAAAHAFAARFYLYARQYEKAIAHADAVLGTDATPMLRDWEQWRKLGANDQVQPNDYIKSSKNTNLLLFTGMSMWGYVSRPVGIGSKYAHGKLLSSSETLESKGPWGEGGTVLNYMVTSGSNVSKVALGKIPLKLDQYDPQAKTGVPYAQFSVFNADETLLHPQRSKIYRSHSHSHPQRHPVLLQCSALLHSFSTHSEEAVAHGLHHRSHHARTPLAVHPSPSPFGHHPRRPPHARCETLWHDHLSSPCECRESHHRSHRQHEDRRPTPGHTVASRCYHSRFAS